MAIWNERIHERRIEKGITLAQIAEALGVTEATAQRYERGNIKSIPYEHMCTYGEILHCSPAYLMGWDEQDASQLESPDIIAYYDQLNATGKEAATEQVRLLTLDEKYTRPDNMEFITREPIPDHLVIKAAHNDAPIDDEELEKMNRDAELLKQLQKKGK